MNASRRNMLDKAIALISEAQAIVQMAAEEEREYYDNMPESLQDGDKGQRPSEVADELETLADTLSAIVNVETLRVNLTQGYVGTANGKTPAYSFQIVDAQGRQLWAGRDFISPENRADAIRIAKRELAKCA